MKIVKYNSEVLESSHLVDEIIRIYIDAFGGYPWDETYTYEQVKKDLFEDMQRPNATCWIVFVEGRVVAFSWGYNYFPDLGKLFEKDIFFGDELAVEQKSQKMGIGPKLFAKVLSDVNAPYILRTMADKPMHKIIKKAGGYDLRAISKGRVIMYVPN